MRYFVFFMSLILATAWALHEEELDLSILLLFLDISYVFLFLSIDVLLEKCYYNTCNK